MNKIEKYPVRARYIAKEGSAIVFVAEFTGPKSMVVVEDPKGTYGVGYKGDSWVPVTNDQYWELLPE